MQLNNNNILCHDKDSLTYDGGFSLCLEGCFLSFALLLGEDTGRVFDALEVLGAYDQGFSRRVEFGHTGHVRERKEEDGDFISLFGRVIASWTRPGFHRTAKSDTR